MFELSRRAERKEMRESESECVWDHIGFLINKEILSHVHKAFHFIFISFFYSMLAFFVNFITAEEETHFTFCWDDMHENSFKGPLFRRFMLIHVS